jgi:hypothetical protein
MADLSAERDGFREIITFNGGDGYDKEKAKRGSDEENEFNPLVGFIEIDYRIRVDFFLKAPALPFPEHADGDQKQTDYQHGGESEIYHQSGVGAGIAGNQFHDHEYDY